MSDEICKLLKRVDEDARGTRCLTMAEVTLCLQELKRLTSVPSERTYTYAEMLLNQAATVNVIGDAIMAKHNSDFQIGVCRAREIALTTIPSDQLALDRHDWKLRKEFMANVDLGIEQKIKTKLADRVREADAKARLEEFDLVISKRPIDSKYWDMHHRNDLLAAHRAAAGAPEEKKL